MAMITYVEPGWLSWRRRDDSGGLDLVHFCYAAGRHAAQGSQTGHNDMH